MDREPGLHEITVGTEVERKRSLNIAVRETKYVKTSLEFGVFVGHPVIDVIDREAGAADLLDMSYTGSETIAGKTAEKHPVTTKNVPAPSNQIASANPQTVDDNAEKWSGLMSCESRLD